MNKRWNLKYGDYATSIEAFKDAGVMLYGSFVLGYDSDTVGSFDPTVEFAIRNKFVVANFNPLTPTPRTRLYERLSRENRLLYDRWWLDPHYRYGEAAFEPRGMTAAQLTEGCFRARSAFNTYGSIFRRLLDRRTHLRSPYRVGVYLLSNLISRREIHAKQGQPMGGPEPLEPLETLARAR